MKDLRKEFEKETCLKIECDEDYGFYFGSYSKWLEQKIIDERKAWNDLLELEKTECQQAMQIMYVAEKTAYRRGRLEEKERVLKVIDKCKEMYTREQYKIHTNNELKTILQELKEVIEEKRDE